MAVVQEEAVFNHPPGEIWNVLADFGAIVQWAPNVDHSCLTTTQAEGVGTVRRIQAGRNVLLEEVLEWEPEHRLSYELQGFPPVVRKVTNTWDLVERDGATHVTLTSDVTAGPRPPHQIAARVIARILGKASTEMLGGLQAHLAAVTA